MGVMNVVNMASHLQNATRARLGLTSVPNTKRNLNVALALHRAGFISFVTRGDAARPPDPATVATYEPSPLTAANAAHQRLWLGLKYGGGGEPVLRTITPVSSPTRRVTADLRALERLARGFDASHQRGLNLGECLFLVTDRGTLEAREAIERRVGGLLLCRAGS